ncbi:MAG: hypothetical protein CVU00_11540 [Bacteroidetes bacterium HGW-Bacteroidetes-17]|nr:MAG: hypothetical protein CVU00_11540 [Bacteroidetes bacterium HGW-Bacteroidetes-17]
MHNITSRRLKITVLICFLFLVISCATKKNRSESANMFTEISFGSGGGFTGASSNYLLKNNGEVYKIVNTIPEKINKISRKEIKKISNHIKKIGFHSLSIDERGNMTYFIDIKSNANIHKVIWTDNSKSPELVELYKILVNTLKPN